VSLGLNDCQIGRYMDIPRGTIRDWRSPRYIPKTPQVRGSDCPLCWGSRLNEERYAYLLGMYLGDGCLSAHPRGVFKLRIVLDIRYPEIIDECYGAIAAMRPSDAMRVGFVNLLGCVEVHGHWKHWPCLFPQHGPGRKHLREIQLVPWQKEIAASFPGSLLRGLIQSDGWRGTNTVRHKNGKVYRYPRYLFSNKSTGIQKIFCEACENFGVQWRRARWNSIAVSRAEDVARLDEVVGLKR
jgi:hypothetical protein